MLPSAEGLGGDAGFKLSDYKRAEGGEEQASGMLGGKKEVSVSDKDVNAAAQEVVKHLSAQSNSLEKMQLAEVRPSTLNPCSMEVLACGLVREMPRHGKQWVVSCSSATVEPYSGGTAMHNV